jgi:hypothetical protein
LPAPHERLKRADALLEELAAAVGDRAELKTKIAAARAELAAAQNAITPSVAPASGGSGTPEAATHPMEDGAFQALFAAMQNERLDRQKLRLLSAAAADNQFYVYQVHELLKLLPAEKVKVGAARILLQHPPVDPDNVAQLYELFRTEAGKQELRSVLEQKHAPEPGR